MLEPVATSKIIEIIQNKDTYLTDINIRVENIMSYVTTDQMTVDAIHELFLPKPMESLGMPPSGGSQGDYSDLIETFLKRQIYHRNELRELLIELLDEKELIERVWGCYMTLPRYPRDLLHKYYVENRIQDAIASEYDISRRTIMRHRDMAIKMIAERYESGIPLNILFKAQEKHNKRIKESNNNIKIIFEMEEKNNE